MTRHRTLSAVLFLLLPAALASAGEDLDRAVEEYAARTRLPETVVTVTRGPRRVFDLPRAVTRIARETIEAQMPRHVVDVLTRRDPGILMDMRTATAGDPIMRGFAGFNILTLVDGNTLTTLWGEGGFGADDLYGKIDPDLVERIEVVRGPNSVLYGSNALGGVIHLVTRSSPFDYPDAGLVLGGRSRTSFLSNMGGFCSRLEVFGATPDLRFLAGVSHERLGNGQGGAGEGTLDPSGGRKIFADLRGDLRIAPGHVLTASFMNMYGSRLHRYYRPNQDNKNERTAVALSWRAEELLGFLTPFRLRLYYQRKRDQRRFDIGLPSERHGFAKTITWSADAQASSDAGGGHYLTFGLHWELDDGESPDDEQFTITTPGPERSDAPRSLWANYGVYLQDEWEAVEDLLTLTLAGRYDEFVFNARETDSYRPEGGVRRADFFRESKGAVTGGLGITVKADEHWRLLASYSRGFRQFAPNFGFRQLGNGVLIPNGLLDPVTSNNYEIGFRTRYPWIRAEGFVWYSDIDKWQALRPDTWQGSRWYDFNGNGLQDANENVISQQSASGAYVWGFEAKASIPLSAVLQGAPAGLSLWGGVAFDRGKVDDGEWFRHIQPARGLLGVRFEDPDPRRGVFAELIAEMVDRHSRIPSDRVKNDLAYRRDPQDPDSPLLRSHGGVPGYTVLSLYTGVNLCESARLDLAVENLLNRKYRRPHSRMDAFGINFVIGLTVSF